MNKATLTKYFK